MTPLAEVVPVIPRRPVRVLAVGAAVVVLAGCGSPQLRSVEELEAMLLGPADLDWMDPLRSGEVGLGEEMPGPAGWGVCADAPAAAVEELADVAGWIAGTVLYQPASEGSGDETTVVAELLTSDDPAALSAALTVATVCPPAADGIANVTQLQPVDIGDEAVVYVYEGSYGGNTGRVWIAWVRKDTVLMELSGGGVSEDGQSGVVPDDETLLTIVTTAARKLR